MRLLRLRNPWGQGIGEWRGAWSDNAPEWKTLDAADRRQLDVQFGPDGEFWMRLDDYIKGHIRRELPGGTTTSNTFTRRVSARWRQTSTEMVSTTDSVSITPSSAAANQLFCLLKYEMRFRRCC